MEIVFVVFMVVSCVLVCFIDCLGCDFKGIFVMVVIVFCCFDDFFVMGVGYGIIFNVGYILGFLVCVWYVFFDDFVVGFI